MGGIKNFRWTTQYMEQSTAASSSSPGYEQGSFNMVEVFKQNGFDHYQVEESQRKPLLEHWVKESRTHIQPDENNPGNKKHQDYHCWRSTFTGTSQKGQDRKKKRKPGDEHPIASGWGGPSPKVCQKNGEVCKSGGMDGISARASIHESQRLAPETAKEILKNASKAAGLQGWRGRLPGWLEGCERSAAEASWTL